MTDAFSVDGSSPASTPRIDEICRRFESHWNSGRRPRLEDFLSEVQQSECGLLLKRLLSVELRCRRSLCEDPLPAEYQDRFPSFEASISAAFANATLSIDGDSRVSEADVTPDLPSGPCIRCPHCFNTTPIPVAQRFSEVTCPACGSRLGLVGDDTLDGRTGRVSGLKPGQFVGHFELLEHLGTGGFGAVWKARDKQLDRLVAVKLPHRRRLDPDETEKFLREARAAAQLQHSNIVSVHEVGLDGERAYIVSDFVEGLPLDKWLADQRPSSRDAAELCLKIARGLNHAHEEGVIHRDLKPSNIMIDLAGEPHIMDFGLAKREVGEVTMTCEGQILGTPAYMSPEQAKGQAHAADCRTDIYSLGVVLFELLTGELPFRGNFRMLLKQVVEDDPPSPRKLNSHVPRDLETICLKCLEKDPSRRYSSTEAFADELVRFLSGIPIQARPVGRLERLGRWCRRNPLVAGSAAAAVLGLLFGLIATSVGYVRTSRALEDTRQAQVHAETSLHQARQAVDDLFTRVSEDALLNQPGMQPLRSDLLRRARNYYEKFLAQSSGDDSLRDELAQAHFRVGLITEQIESPGKALPAYEKARGIQAVLAETAPGRSRHLVALGDTLNAIGRCLHKQQRMERTLAAYSAAAEVRARLVEKSPASPEFQRTLANTYMNLGLAEKTRDPTRARQFFQKAQHIRQGLLSEIPDDAKLRRDLAKGYYNLGTLAASTGGGDKAAQLLEKARGLFADLVADDAADLNAAYRLAVCNRIAADLKCSANRPEEALSLYAAAREVLGSLAERNPSVPEYQVGLAEVYINLAQTQYEQDQREAAVANFEHAQRLLTPLVSDHAEHARYRGDFIVALRAVGKLHPDADRRAEALAALETLERHLQRLADRLPDAGGVREQLQMVKAAIKDLQADQTVHSAPPSEGSGDQ